MFKAIDINDQKEIIIIDDQWNKHSIEDLPRPLVFVETV